ncbi:hypothetical protein IWW38_002263 [Coemansia aciculifera]|uniref:Uncharacterized protein n=1 Tax=Coemansia aciculifera TaxID=417176 RepID=A0ACC1M5W6_9FUNG|nr:hypothetical protein IWW38_002263 [Coemansia aciculifera]
MDPTRSEVLIEQSREYKEKGQEVMDQIMAKKMTGVEGRQILDDKVKELKRVMDARRHKTKSVARKKIEKNYEKLMKKGWDKRDFDMDTVRHDERYLIDGDDYSVYIPSLEVTNDCKNIARIIKWNDHMAVLTELKPVRRRARLQYRRPLSPSTTTSLREVDREEIDVFVDIEAFNRECEDNYAEQVPYLVCWADNDEVNSVSGEDCMEEFVDRILAKCTYDQCKLRNNAIIYAEFVFEHLKLRIHLKDPFLFILTNQFEHLLNDEDKYLAYRFAIMRKRIVGVQNRNIIKLIKKT